MLVNKKLEVLFVSSDNKKSGISPIIRNQGYSLVQFNIALTFFRGINGGLTGYFKAVGSLRKYLRNNNFDIIHAHYGLCGIVALLSKKKQKLVISFMGDDLVGSNKPDGSVTLLSKVFVWMNIFLAKYIYDHSIVKSLEMMQSLKNLKNVSLIPNGVDLEKYNLIDKDTSRDKVSFEKESRNVIFVSNPERPEKNFQLAKNAVQSLNDSSVKLHIINGVENNLLSDYYNAADAMIMTSFHEGSPNVIKEAMACNCPIVSTPVGDSKWVMGDTAGCYITTFNVEDTADKLKKALEFSMNNNRTAGRKRIIELGLDSKNVAKKIINIYNILLCKD